MSRALLGALAGLGQGVSQYGGMLFEADRERQRLESMRAQRLQELADKYAMDARERQQRLAEARPMFGLDKPAPTQDQFLRQDYGAGIDSDFKSPDKDAFARADQERKDNELRAQAYVDGRLRDVDSLINKRNLDREIEAAGNDPKKLREVNQRELTRQGRPLIDQDLIDARVKALEARAGADEARARGDVGGRGGGAPRVQSTKSDGDGNLILVMSDGSIRRTSEKTGSFEAEVTRVANSMQKQPQNTGRSMSDIRAEARAILLSERAQGASSSQGGSSSEAGASAPRAATTPRLRFDINGNPIRN